MLRLRRPLCSPLPYFRQCRGVTRGIGFANVHHVKFKRPWIRRFATTCLLYGAAFHLWSSLLFLQFDGNIETDPPDNKTANKSVSQGAADNVVEEDFMFIPLGWPRIRPGELYASSDAEWQEFAKMAQDKQRLKLLRDQLATLVCKKASDSVDISRLLGGPLTLTGAWLVHRFPYRAPPHYEQSGLEISNTHVSWVSKPISPEQGDRIRKVLQPLAVTSAVSDAFKVVWKRQLQRLREFLHPEGSRYPSGSIIAVAETALQPKVDEKDTSSLSGIEMLGPNSLKEGFSRNEDRGRPHPSLVITILQRIPFPSFAPGSDLHQASMAFKRRLRESWSRHRPTPKRGVFYIAGPVGLKGPRGYCRIEVYGEYDPTARSWTFLRMHLKDLNLYTRKPLGGR